MTTLHELAALLDAASPDVVLGLLQERDQLHAVAVRLKAALDGMLAGDRDCDVTAAAILTDPEVEKL